MEQKLALDSMGSLRSGYGPSIMMNDVGKPFALLLSAINTECVGVLLSGAAFTWIPVLAPRRDKPSWAISASSGSTIEASMLTEAGIDPLPTVSTNLSLFLVPTIYPFTFKLPSLDNLGFEDMSALTTAHGTIVAEWAHIMLLAHEKGAMALTLYNNLEGQDLHMRYIGPKAEELSLHINKHGPCLSAVSCTSSSHPDDYRTVLSRLGGEAIAAAILPPAPVFQHVVVTSSDETKEKNNMANGYNTLLAIMICAKHDPDSNALSALNFPVPTEAFKRVSELTTKDEHVRALKNILDTDGCSGVRAQHDGYVTRLQRRGSHRPRCHYHWHLCQNTKPKNKRCIRCKGYLSFMRVLGVSLVFFPSHIVLWLDIRVTDSL